MPERFSLDFGEQLGGFSVPSEGGSLSAILQIFSLCLKEGSPGKDNAQRAISPSTLRKILRQHDSDERKVETVLKECNIQHIDFLTFWAAMDTFLGIRKTWKVAIISSQKFGAANYSSDEEETVPGTVSLVIPPIPATVMSDLRGDIIKSFQVMRDCILSRLPASAGACAGKSVKASLLHRIIKQFQDQAVLRDIESTQYWNHILGRFATKQRKVSIFAVAYLIEEELRAVVAKEAAVPKGRDGRDSNAGGMVRDSNAGAMATTMSRHPTLSRSGTPVHWKTDHNPTFNSTHDLSSTQSDLNSHPFSSNAMGGTKHLTLPNSLNESLLGDYRPAWRDTNPGTREHTSRQGTPSRYMASVASAYGAASNYGASSPYLSRIASRNGSPGGQSICSSRIGQTHLQMSTQEKLSSLLSSVQAGGSLATNMGHGHHKPSRESFTYSRNGPIKSVNSSMNHGSISQSSINHGSMNNHSINLNASTNLNSSMTRNASTLNLNSSMTMNASIREEAMTIKDASLNSSNFSTIKGEDLNMSFLKDEDADLLSTSVGGTCSSGQISASDSLKAKVVAEQQQTTQQHKQIEILQAEIEHLKRNQESASKLENNGRETLILLERVKGKENELIKLQAELDNAKEEVSRLKSNRQEPDQEKVELSREKAELNREKAELEQKLKKEREAFLEKDEEAKFYVQKLQQQVERDLAERQALEQNHAAILEQREQDYQSQREENAKEQAEKLLVMAQLFEQKEEEVKGECQEQLSQFEEGLRSKNRELESKVSEMKTRISSLEQELELSRHEFQTSTKQSEIVQEELVAKQTKIAKDFQLKIDESSDEITHLRKQLEESQYENNELSSKLQMEKKQLQSTKQKMETMERKIQDMIKKEEQKTELDLDLLSEKQQQIAELEQELEKVHSTTLKEMSEQLRKQKYELTESLTKDFERKQTQLKEFMHIETENLEEKYAKEYKEKWQLKEKELNFELKEKVGAAKAAEETKNRAEQDAFKKNTEQELTTTLTVQLTAKLTSEITNHLEREYEKKIENFRNVELNTQKAKFDAQKGELKKEKEGLESKIAEMDQKLKDNFDENLDKCVEVKKLKTIVEELKKENAVCKAGLVAAATGSKDETHDAKKQISNLQQEISDLKEKLISTKVSLDSSNQQLQVFKMDQNENLLLKKKLRHREDEITALKRICGEEGRRLQEEYGYDLASRKEDFQKRMPKPTPSVSKYLEACNLTSILKKGGSATASVKSGVTNNDDCESITSYATSVTFKDEPQPRSSLSGFDQSFNLNQNPQSSTSVFNPNPLNAQQTNSAAFNPETNSYSANYPACETMCDSKSNKSDSKSVKSETSTKTEESMTSSGCISTGTQQNTNINRTIGLVGAGVQLGVTNGINLGTTNSIPLTGAGVELGRTNTSSTVKGMDGDKQDHSSFVFGSLGGQKLTPAQPEIGINQGAPGHLDNQPGQPALTPSATELQREERRRRREKREKKEAHRRRKEEREVKKFSSNNDEQCATQ